MSKQNRFFLSFLFILFFALTTCYAIDDNFSQARKTQSQYFTICYAPGVDEGSLAQRLNIGEAERILTEEPESSDPFSINSMVDTLFRRASDILDMHIYSFQCTIKVCRNYEELQEIYSSLFDAPLSQKSFYVYSLNTIYTYPEAFTREIIGHEIAHAVVSRYFAVSPPIKVQEILAGYVEYQLRKGI